MEFIDKYSDVLVTALVSTPVGALLLNIVNKRKLNAESKSLELDNESKIIEMYDKALDSLEQRMKVKHEENAKEIEELKKKLEDVEAYWKKKYDDLKKQFDQYKKDHP